MCVCLLVWIYNYECTYSYIRIHIQIHVRIFLRVSLHIHTLVSPWHRRLGTVRAVSNQGVNSLSIANSAPAPAAVTNIQTDSKQALLQSVGKKCWISEQGSRQITNAEVLAVVARTGGLSTDELVNYLTKRGYTGDVREAMLAKVLIGAKGQLELSQPEQDLEKAANLFAQADQYEEEAKTFETEANVFVEQSRALGPELLSLTESIDALKPQVELYAWLPGWVPFGPRTTMADMTTKLDLLADKRKALDQQYDGLDVQAQEKFTNCNWDREDAGILRDNALKALVSCGLQEEADALAAATKVIESAEEALASNGPTAAFKQLVAGSEALESISLRPDRKASPGSLPGRLSTILSAPTISSKKAAAPAGGEFGDWFKFW